ncbi:hypothetical protein [Pyxidicoccus xibeiensis]|uniref:hypothetical protein n=1 Tax=Pyxidicoccus xibeiensis TaxID=2906759 RepID=UPI0020A7E4C2|nr:hypothetical protein [Pyxidicoccus xibeiensis]MCP3136585.1 hypothetical protein [Pyxidicoccus xibeiensis]
MNHLHTSLLTAALLFTSASAAEEYGPPPVEPPRAHRTLLGMSITALQYGELSLEGERVVSPRVSVALGLRAGLSSLSVRASSEFAGGDNDQLRTMLGVAPAARFFLTGSAPEGLWLSPRLEATREWVDYKASEEGAWNFESTESAWSFGGAALVGYTTIVGRGLAIQGGVGLAAVHERNRRTLLTLPSRGTEGASSEVETRNRSWSVGPRMDVSVGWAF